MRTSRNDRKTLLRTCVIMVTAVDDAKTSVKAMNVGAFDYVIKPFDMEDVVLKVREAIEKRNLRLESELHHFNLRKGSQN